MGIIRKLHPLDWLLMAATLALIAAVAAHFIEPDLAGGWPADWG